MPSIGGVEGVGSGNDTPLRSPTIPEPTKEAIAKRSVCGGCTVAPKVKGAVKLLLGEPRFGGGLCTDTTFKVTNGLVTGVFSGIVTFTNTCAVDAFGIRNCVIAFAPAESLATTALQACCPTGTVGNVTLRL